ncbi:macrophage mannose receptor 1-like [Sphaeramia orbicularis]|uniref:macrophage mannose receptor 1-like n=1 Tax=Sphaeramia orbicularis TaxID=375764 RepID=UPI00117D4A60|nr:macrophage mannose receptor 1-like [Sphaeramia orbicularis]
MTPPPGNMTPPSGTAPSSGPPPPPSGPFCPDGWQWFSGRCYYFVKNAMTWPQAQTNCAVLGAVLVSVRSPQEHGFIQQQFNNNDNNRPPGTWLGGFYLQDQWLWVDGSWFYNNSLTFETEPNTSPCLFLSPSGEWISSLCNEGYSSICVQESNSGPPGLCPDGWVDFQGQCYFYNQDLLTWSDADTFCAEFEASLVSVHSPQEYHLLGQITSGSYPFWMGGFYLQGQWMWLDGSWFHQDFFGWNAPVDSYPCLAPYPEFGGSGRYLGQVQSHGGN